jgi:small-conductance mechanosensitive channel
MRRSGGSHRVYGVALALCLSLSLPVARAEPPSVAESLPAPEPKGEDAALLAPGAAPAQPAPYNPTALRFFSRDITVFHAVFLGISPADRARFAERRLVELIERGGPGQVLVRDLPQGSMVSLDGAFVFLLTPDDVAQELDPSPHRAAERAASVLRQVIAETREARNVGQLLHAAAAATGATLLLWLLSWLLFKLRRVVQHRMVALATRQSERLQLSKVKLFSLEGLVTVLGHLTTATLSGLFLLLVYEWVVFVLGRFPYTRPWSEQLNGFLLKLILGLLRAVLNAVPGLIVAGVIFALARVFAGALDRFFSRVQAGQFGFGWLDADTARPTRRIAGLGLWLFALAMAYPYLPGAQTDAFKGISVLLGLMVSLGGSSIVAHAGSGLILMYTRPYRTGEYVQIGEHEGTIVLQGTFTTRLRTGMGEEVVLPNALVIGATIKNYSRAVKGSGFVLDTSVTIGYDAPWRQVEALLCEAAQRTPGILSDPAPRVFQTRLDDFYVEYRLVTQATAAEAQSRAEALTALHRNVQDVFNEHGVQIMSPHYLGDPQQAKIVPPADWYRAPAKPEPR